jgi:hypothetical protein
MSADCRGSLSLVPSPLCLDGYLPERPPPLPHPNLPHPTAPTRPVSETAPAWSNLAIADPEPRHNSTPPLQYGLDADSTPVAWREHGHESKQTAMRISGAMHVGEEGTGAEERRGKGAPRMCVCAWWHPCMACIMDPMLCSPVLRSRSCRSRNRR